MYQEQEQREIGVIPKSNVLYEADLKDLAVIDDVLRLIHFFVEKVTAGITVQEKDRLIAVVYDFLLPFFFLGREKPKAKPQSEEGAMDVDSKTPSTDAPEKKVDSMEVDPAAPQEKDIPTWARQNVLYANGSLFTLVRLFQFAFNRLETLKELGGKVESDPFRPGKRNANAIELGLQIPLFRKAFPSFPWLCDHPFYLFFICPA